MIQWLVDERFIRDLGPDHDFIESEVTLNTKRRMMSHGMTRFHLG